MKSYPKLLVFQTVTTGYYPPPQEGYASEAEAKMEGGAEDCHGNPLYTLQDFIEGKAPYVSVAMDKDVLRNQLPYGTLLSIPAICLYYQLPSIEFRVVDTGGTFAGCGLKRMDVCVRSRKESFSGLVNRNHLVVALIEDAECRKHQGWVK